MSYESTLDAAGRALDASTLNSHLRDFDVSDRRDRAIEARAADLLERRGPKGYHPLGENVALLFDERYTAGDVLGWIVGYFEAGRYVDAGKVIADVLHHIACTEAAAEAAIQIDREWNEASGAALDAYDDRTAGQ